MATRTLVKVGRETIITGTWASNENLNRSNLNGRKSITSFSKSSGHRMARFLRDCECEYTIMGTLTYPSDHQISHKKCSADFRQFIKSLARRVGHQPNIFWFREFTKAGQFHYHFFTDERIDKNVLSELWWRACGRISENHRIAGTRIESIRGGRRGLIAYAIKYAKKHEQKQLPEKFRDGAGRWWGIIGNRKVVVAATSFEHGTRDNRKKTFHFMQKIKKLYDDGKIVLIDSNFITGNFYKADEETCKKLHEEMHLYSETDEA